MTPAQGTQLVRESEIEAYLVKRVKALGGLCYKFVSPGRVGVPDRIVILNGNVVFVEVKSPTGALTPLQMRTLDAIADQGVPAGSVSSRESVDRLIAGIIGDD